MLICLLLVLFAVMSASCQQTPTQEIVISKNKEQLEKAIGATAEPPEESAETDEAEKQETNGPIVTPETTLDIWEAECSEGDMLYTLDAEAHSLIGSLPILRARAHEITSDEVQNLAYAVFGEDAFFYETREVMTKPEIERRILDLTRWMNDTEGLLACANNDPEQAERDRQRYQEEIDYWEERYETAAEEYNPVQTDWVFRPQSYYDDELVFLDGEVDICETDKNYYIQASVVQDGDVWEIVAFNRDADSYMTHTLSYNLSWQEQVQLPVVELSEKEALELAEDLITTIDTEKKWYLYDCQHVITKEHDFQKPDDVYYLTYVPVYYGVPMLGYTSATLDWDAERYAPSYAQETLELTIKGGMVVDYSWKGAMEIVAVENDNALCLSSEEMMEQCMNQLIISYPLDRLKRQYESRIDMAHLIVEKAECGFARVLVPDEREEYYLIPSWSLYGTKGIDWGRGNGVEYIGSEGIREDEFYTVTAYREDREALLILSALDGSVINTELGY